MSTKLQTTRLSKAMLIGALLLPALAPAQTAYSWMSPDVKNAWTQGYKGQGTTITVVDDFSNSSRFSGNLGTGVLNQGHGYWTALEAAMIAPEAKVVKRNWSSTSVALNPSGLNVLNLSYGMYARSNLDVNRIAWSGQEKSIISYAKGGTAVVVKAAGNDAVAVGKANRSGNVDYLNVAPARRTGRHLCRRLEQQRHHRGQGQPGLVFQLRRHRQDDPEQLPGRRRRQQSDRTGRHLLRCTDHQRLRCCCRQQIHQSNLNPDRQSVAHHGAHRHHPQLSSQPARTRRSEFEPRACSGQHSLTASAGYRQFPGPARAARTLT